MAVKTRIWLVGRTNRLGSALEHLIDKSCYHLIATDAEDVDITKLNEVMHYADHNRPAIIVNCAAMDNHQACEHDPEAAFLLNALGARNLAIAAEEIGAHLFYLSSDFVFDGQSAKPYSEFDRPNPMTAYGRSKLAGEEYVRTLCRTHTIIRSSWLYGKRLLLRLIEKVQETGYLSVSGRFVGSPTSSLVLAQAMIGLFDTVEYGTFHISCEGSCTENEFLREIADYLGIKNEIRSTSEQGPFEFMRPHYAVLENRMLRLTGRAAIKPWREALHEFIDVRHIRRT